MPILTDDGKRLVERIARKENVRCLQCGSGELESAGVIERYKGDVRATFLCTNKAAEHPDGYTVYWTVAPDTAQRIGLPIPPYRR